MAMAAREGGTDTGLRLIIAFKVAKASGEVVLAALLGVVFASESAGRDVAAALGRHVTGAWSLRIGELLVRADTPHTVELTIGALVLDAVLTLCEGWALHRRFVWAPWVVVIATGSLLPFEVFELIRRPRAVRLLIFLVNVGIVGYLSARATRELRRRQR